MTTVVGAPAVRTVAIDDPGPLPRLLPDAAGLAWLRRGDGLVGWGEAARFASGTGGDRIARLSALWREWCATAVVADPLRLPGTGPVAFGSMTFDPHADGSTLVVPRVVVGRRDGLAWVTVVGREASPGGQSPTLASPPGGQSPTLASPPGGQLTASETSPGGQLTASETSPGELLAGTPPLRAPGRVRYAGAGASELAWMEAVAAAVREISAGNLRKVVLARDLHVWAEEELDLRALADRLAARFPDCYTFAVDRLVGATPELLVRRVGHDVESLALAGSAARGADARDDAALGEALLGSDKDGEEHRLAVDSVRDVLAGLCTRLDVGATELIRLENVQHLGTALRGRLAGEAPPSALEVADALHPTAAVCGTPTATALELIRRLENLDRGRYAGPVGWVDARGDGEWGIALRCAAVSGQRARLFAGAGIVAASLPEAELEETRLKLRAMQSALED